MAQTTKITPLGYIVGILGTWLIIVPIFSVLVVLCLSILTSEPYEFPDFFSPGTWRFVVLVILIGSMIFFLSSLTLGLAFQVVYSLREISGIGPYALAGFMTALGGCVVLHSVFPVMPEFYALALVSGVASGFVYWKIAAKCSRDFNAE